jgi:endoglucanase
MKKAIVFAVLILIGISGCVSEPPAPKMYGQLQVIGSQLCDSKGTPVQLRGMSSNKFHYFGMFLNTDSFTWLRDEWKCNLVRAAMYTGENGYISPMKAKIKNKMIEVVQAAIDTGIYVIIDWHILSDKDPNEYKEESKAFFTEMATMFGKYPNVMYEICNEPNGENVTWKDKIKPYAEYIIPAIRAVDPDNIIIVGTDTWSQGVDAAARDPLNFTNIMYTCHFYAGTHQDWLRNRVSQAINGAFGNKIAIFVTEWGTTDSSGKGMLYLDESIKWLDFLAANKISWANWSLSDLKEDSAALKPGASYTGGWPMNMLSESGKFIYSYLQK